MQPQAALHSSFYLVLFSLLAAIAVIVILTTRFKVHPFFALVIGAITVGCIAGFPLTEVLSQMKDGFGNIMRSLAFIIIFGTALGTVLEKTGATAVMADYILHTAGRRFPVLAMSITGFIVGMPLFCDSGFIVLSGMNASLARRSGKSVVVMAVAMATGLYSVHCLIPPHPGATAAAAALGVDYGRLILFGLIVAVPAVLAGYFYAQFAGRKLPVEAVESQAVDAVVGPPVLYSFLPVIVPVILIAARSFIDLHATASALKLLLTAGDPVVALAIGLLIALITKKNIAKMPAQSWLQQGAEKAGSILVIIGAGGAFGAVLNATQIGKQFSNVLPLGGMGLLFPFLLAFVLKTAQGSSTVAIITAASIVQPLLPALGLVTPDQKLLCVLSMGAGSMMISHANDAYFWVISKFERIEMKPMLKVYSLATILMGLVSFITIFLLSLLF